MKYLMLVCRDTTGSATPPSAADMDGAPDVTAWWEDANATGSHVLGERLRPAAEALTVRVRGGRRLVTQGPFTEVSELVAGFDVLDCDTLERAVEIAAGHPMAYGGVIELRAMWPFEEDVADTAGEGQDTPEGATTA